MEKYMKLENLELIKDEDIDLDKYYEFYYDVRAHMEFPEWLGVIPMDIVKEELANGGKLWIYKNDTDYVASIMFLPSHNNSLKKHNIIQDESIVGCCGPTMVNRKYVGNKLHTQMLKVLHEYAKSVGMKYMETRVHPDNIYSVHNFVKDGYEVVDTYMSEDGPRSVFFKEL
jgi:hypothetical protein